MPRFVIPADTPARSATVSQECAVFVNVIAEMHDELYGCVVGNNFIGIEVAESVIRTTRNCQHEPVEVTDGQRPCPANGRYRAIDDELIEIGCTRRKIVDDLFDGVIAFRTGRELAVRHDVQHLDIRCHVPVDSNGSLRTADAGPDHDTHRVRIATRHTVCESRTRIRPGAKRHVATGRRKHQRR